MHSKSTKTRIPASAVSRLTALWALNEAGLGGVMHALKIPFTGLLVGGMAVMLITLIAYYSDKKYTEIIKALTIVLIVKLAVSSHSPITAYLAVSFQAMLGAVLYSIFSHFKLGAMILGISAMLESAVQKILVLTIWFGKDIWEAIDIYYNSLAARLGFEHDEYVHISYWILGGFILLYGVGGVIIGWFAGKLPEEIESALRKVDPAVFQHQVKHKREPHNKAGINRLLKYVFYFLLILALFLAFTVLQPGDEPYNKGIYLLIRALLIIGAWYLIITPVIKRILQAYLSKKKGKYASEVDHVISFLPQLRRAIAPAWYATRGNSWYVRLKSFILHIVVFTLTFQSQPGNK